MKTNLVVSKANSSLFPVIFRRATRPALYALAFLLVALLVISFPQTAQVASVPTGFSDVQVASGLAMPVAMEFAPDGRLFVSEQAGKVRVIKNGVLLATPFADLTAEVDSTGERGLMGIAFDPNFSTNHYLYVYYTAKSPVSHNRLSRLTANGDVALAGSEVVILELNNLGLSTFHNGGAIHFGQDGKLYVASGDNTVSDNADSFQNLLGKILRINSDGSIPTDNPFYNTASGNNRAIWALGLRNPYTFAVQPGTGRIFINDVGENTWEEINDGIAGSHYGWPNVEGPSSNSNYRSPLYAYQHGASSDGGCAITGGSFYNPPSVAYPASYVGQYFFADYCAGWIRRFDPATNSVTGFVTGIASPVDLKVSSDGNLYYLARGTGSNTGIVSKITYNSSTPTPQSDTVYLSDLTTNSVVNGWGPIELDRSNGEQGSNDGHTITLNGVTYAKGLGVHANSSIQYQLNGGYTSFQADIGVDDEVGSNGSVVFKVALDGSQVYESGLMLGDSPTQSININVTGAQVLLITVEDGGNGNTADHADWAGARLLKAAGQAPAITQQPASQTVSPGQAATFTVGASGTAPLSYQWQRNGVNIAGATSQSYTLASATSSDNGAKFRAVVTNPYGSATSNEATLTVTNNQPPTATITGPANGTLYAGGDVINFGGFGTDPEDSGGNVLPDSAYSWEIVFHHDTHTHPFLTFNGVSSGHFTIPTVGETSANVWYRIHLTVKDSAGATTTTFVDILPRKSTMTFATSPAGLQIAIDGQPRTTPFSVEGVVGIQRTLTPTSPQTVNGTTYLFSSWSDGNTSASRTISTPPSNTTYTAIFVASGTPTPTPTPTPAPTPTPGQPASLTDDFNDNSRNAAKWGLGLVSKPASAIDTQVSVAEQNQRLEITPRAGISGTHYNGYLSVATWDLTGGTASVEVKQATNSGANTIFAIGLDNLNSYRFVTEDGRLYFQRTSEPYSIANSVPYNPTTHRFWRFRHDAATDQIIFETSPDGVSWTVMRSLARTITIKALRAELSAGTFTPIFTPGTAIFDNFSLQGATGAGATTTAVGFDTDLASAYEGQWSEAVITVRRVGDTTTPFTVEYTTFDNAGQTPCQASSSGRASERCDYATTAGVLRFASGEITKTIRIPIINDFYLENGEEFFLLLRNPRGATLNFISQMKIVIVDDLMDSDNPDYNPLDTLDFFVSQQYVDFLGRIPDYSGYVFWTDRISNCPAGQLCDRTDASQRFFQSDEFQARGFLVYRLYDAVLGRLPLYSEFMMDVGRLNGFQTVDEQQQNKDSYLADFINKSEFRTLYGQYLSGDGTHATDATGFVNALCARAGITPASKQTLINNLQSGARTPAQTLEDFILTPEIGGAGTKFYDRGFITMQYFGYLRRDPDQGGFNFWVSQLMGANAPHKGDYRFMVGGFLQSDEYNFRFAPIHAK